MTTLGKQQNTTPDEIYTRASGKIKLFPNRSNPLNDQKETFATIVKTLPIQRSDPMSIFKELNRLFFIFYSAIIGIDPEECKEILGFEKTALSVEKMLNQLMVDDCALADEIVKRDTRSTIMIYKRMAGYTLRLHLKLNNVISELDSGLVTYLIHGLLAECLQVATCIQGMGVVLNETIVSNYVGHLQGVFLQPSNQSEGHAVCIFKDEKRQVIDLWSQKQYEIPDAKDIPLSEINKRTADMVPQNHHSRAIIRFQCHLPLPKSKLELIRELLLILKRILNLDFVLTSKTPLYKFLELGEKEFIAFKNKLLGIIDKKLQRMEAFLKFYEIKEKLCLPQPLFKELDKKVKLVFNENKADVVIAGEFKQIKPLQDRLPGYQIDFVKTKKETYTNIVLRNICCPLLQAPLPRLDFSGPQNDKRAATVTPVLVASGNLPPRAVPI